MQDVGHLDDFSNLQTLADPSRVAILRLLMAGPATLTQLGAKLGKHPAWVRHHILQLERAGLIALAETRKVANYTEKYYRATARVFSLAAMILPDPGERGLVVIVGSDDPALHLLAEVVERDEKAPMVFTLANGSLEGLIALRSGVGDAAGCHLLDPDTGEFNLPYARRILPGRHLACVTLAEREQGLVVPPGNPLGVRSLVDVAERGLRFVNRNDGSGTRLWLDHSLSLAHLSAAALNGYCDMVATHDDVARAVEGGGADAGIGVRAAALAHGLDFIPLFEERYDLVMPWDRHEDRLVQQVLERLHDAAFKHSVRALGGYSTQHTGDEREVAA